MLKLLLADYWTNYQTVEEEWLEKERNTHDWKWSLWNMSHMADYMSGTLRTTEEGI